MKVKILNLVRIILIFTSIFIFLVGIIMLIDFLKTNDTISIISAIIIFSVSVLTFMLSRKLNNKINDTRVIMKDKVNVNQEKSTSADSLNDKSSIKITYSNSNKEINNNKSKGVIPEYCYNKDDFVVLDFETTGFNSYSDRIVEVAALKYMGGELKDSFNTLINPDIKIHRHSERICIDTVEEIVEGYDVVIDATDNFSTRYLLSDCCYYLKKPIIEDAAAGYDGIIMTIIPDKTPCYRCLYPMPPEDGVMPSCSDTGILGMVTGIIGSIEALEAIKVVTGLGETISGRILTFDALSTEFDQFELQKNEYCPLCGKNPTVKELVEYTIKCKTKDIEL